MAQITATQASPAIAEIWRTVALKALFSKMVVKNRILNVTEDIASMGDILHVKINPVPTVGDITAATGAFTPEQVSLTDVTLTVNKWKYVAHDVVDIADIQSDISLIENFSEAFVPALGEQIENDILGLYSSLATVGNVIGASDSGSVFGDDVILPAELALDDLKVPVDDRSWILPPVAVKQLRKDQKWVYANATGLPKGVQTTGIMFDIYGVPTYMTQLAPSSALGSLPRVAMLLHKNGLMVGIQRNIKMEKFARTQFSTPFASSVLYGTAICRDNHVAPCYVKRTLS